MAEPVYGAFGDILSLEEGEKKGVDPIIYNVYQQRSQQYQDPKMQQYTYDTDLMEEYRKMSAAGQVPSDLISPDEIMKQAMRDLGSSVAGQAGASVGAAVVDPYYSGMSTIGKVGEGLKNTFSLNPTASATRLGRLSGDLSPLGDDLVILPSLSTESAASNVGQANLETFKSLKDSVNLMKCLVPMHLWLLKVVKLAH